jgi:hypothetical protein
MFGQHPGYFKAVFLKQTLYTAKINDIWTKNEINNNNNHKAS